MQQMLKCNHSFPKFEYFLTKTQNLAYFQDSSVGKWLDLSKTWLHMPYYIYHTFTTAILDNIRKDRVALYLKYVEVSENLLIFLYGNFPTKHSRY